MITPQYLAGMVDADGHLIWRAGKHQAPTVGVTNTSVDLMDALKAEVGGSVSVQRRSGMAMGYTRRRDVYKWSIVGERAAIVIRNIRPFLIVKPDKADHLLALWDAATANLERPKRRAHHIEKERKAMAALGWD